MKYASKIFGSGTVLWGLWGLWALLAGCSGNDQAATVQGATGGGPSLGTGGSGGIVLGTGGGGGLIGGSGSGSGATAGVGVIPGSHDGGTTPLTSDQITTIETSSCAGWASEGESLPSILELVVDTSLSMNDVPKGSNMSKWVLTQGALGQAIDGLSPKTSVGVLFYPNKQTQAGNPQTAPRDVSACVNVSAMVPIDVLGAAGSQQRTTLQTGLDRAGPNGSTPTHDAYRYALINGIESYQSSYPKFMLIITDGTPTFSVNCEGSGNTNNPSPTQPIIDEIAGALASGVRTFIIGSPGSEQGPNGTDERTWLSKAARAGGTATVGCSDTGPNFCHMDMTQAPDFGAALAAGLGQITGQIDSCTYSIPAPPAGQTIDLGKVNMITTINGASELIQPDNMGDCTEGWQLNSSGQVVLCSATCARVRSDVNAKVELLFGCGAGDIQIPK